MCETNATKGRDFFSVPKVYECEFRATDIPTYWPTDLNKTAEISD